MDGSFTPEELERFKTLEFERLRGDCVAYSLYKIPPPEEHYRFVQETDHAYSKSHLQGDTDQAPESSQDALSSSGAVTPSKYLRHGQKRQRQMDDEDLNMDGLAPWGNILIYPTNITPVQAKDTHRYSNLGRTKALHSGMAKLLITYNIPLTICQIFMWPIKSFTRREECSWQFGQNQLDRLPRTLRSWEDHISKLVSNH
jgi:hypothetical protein